ncbi:MAG TPA: hypothetical protein IAA30_03330, partial [Candidatus Treponema faecavium]|nr:hypothetical protein [Candidatus Treponema faecavium]
RINGKIKFSHRQIFILYTAIFLSAAKDVPVCSCVIKPKLCGRNSKEPPQPQTDKNTSPPRKPLKENKPACTRRKNTTAGETAKNKARVQAQKPPTARQSFFQEKTIFFP